MSVFMVYVLKILFVYIVIRSIISYYNYRRSLVLYRNVIEFLEKYSNDEIGWYVSIASALIKCQQYEYAHRYLTETKSKFSSVLAERHDLEEEIDIKAVQQDLKQIDKEIAEVDKELNIYLKELGLEEI